MGFFREEKIFPPLLFLKNESRIVTRRRRPGANTLYSSGYTLDYPGYNPGPILVFPEVPGTGKIELRSRCSSFPGRPQEFTCESHDFKTHKKTRDCSRVVLVCVRVYLVFSIALTAI